MNSLLRLVGCLAGCLGVGYLASLATAPEIPTWYAALRKPSWTPPDLAFPIVWTLLYGMMAIALWRLSNALPSDFRRQAINLFLLQLALNAIWSPIFFSLHAIGVALVVIVLLLFAIAATMRAAFKTDRLAAWLLAPYLAWVCYATTLNAGILWLNRT
jgi:benzodiazapine receptor